MRNILDELFDSVENQPSKEANLTDREKCATSLELFAQTYFPDIFDKEFCEFHKEVIKSIENIILKKKYTKNYYCRAAPRGHGKSQIISFLLPLWCICYNYKFNILIVSDTNDQAKQFIIDIKAQLEENEKLIADFGNLEGKVIWAQDKIVTANNVHVCGKGAGQKLRGIKWQSKRPDLVIIDDLENDESVETDTQRDKLKRWFLKALLPVGMPFTDYIYIGTILHYESLLNTILTNSNFTIWDRKIYRAVYKFSDSPLWEKWENILTDLSNENASEDAYNFYLRNKKQMLKGIVTLWPQQDEDYYYNLMVTRLQDEAAFNSEFQNEPIDPNKQEFKQEWIDQNMYEVLPEITDIYIACDPSMGKNRQADSSAIILLGKGIDNYLYVLLADIKRRPPDAIIEDLIYHSVANIDKLRKVVLETQVFQEFFADELRKKAVNLSVYLPIEEIKQTSDKDLRIRSLIPKVKNGYIKFHKSQAGLLRDMRHFPKGRKDGLDALHMAVNAASGGLGGLVFGGINYSRNRR